MNESTEHAEQVFVLNKQRKVKQKHGLKITDKGTSHYPHSHAQKHKEKQRQR